MKKITLILPILLGYLLSTVPSHAYRDLESGVFLSRDPAGHVDGPNVYTYVKQNPWTKFDPEGLKPESVNEFTHPDTGRTVGLMQMPGEFQRGYSKARGQAASLGADFTPILGGFKGAYEAAIGKDAITKEPLTTGQRVGAGIGTAVSWIPGGKAGVKGLARLLTRGAKDVDKGAKTARGITKTSEKVVETVIQAEGPAAKGLPGKSLLPGEGAVGTYDDLIAAGSKGDNITPHHIPSANHMEQYGVSKGDGIAINMEQPFPGSGGRHRATFTYGIQADLNLTPRQALGQGIWDARRIYQQDGLYSPGIRASLQDVIRQNRAANPGLFNK